jgi:hypothetical protein
MPATTESLEAKLEELLGIVEGLQADRDIVQRLHSYCHAIDHGSEEEFLDCFTDTAKWSMGFAGSTDARRFEGRADNLEFIQNYTRAPEVVQKHLLLEPKITRNGDAANARSYWLLIAALADGQPYVNSYGRYDDQLVRGADGVWRFSERMVEVEHWSATE